jgi:hypothetical protein
MARARTVERTNERKTVRARMLHPHVKPFPGNVGTKNGCARIGEAVQQFLNSEETQPHVLLMPLWAFSSTLG